MKRPVAVLVALTLLVSGCRFSKVKSDAAVHISGRALTAAGAPLANTTVRLFKQADLGEVLVGAVLAVGSLGTICLLPDAPAICNSARKATTDANGSFTFVVKGSDTQGLVGTEATLAVVIGTPGATGSSTTVTFNARANTVTLPDARLWNSAARVSQGEGDVTVNWSSLGAGYGTNAAYSAQLLDAKTQAQLWTQNAAKNTAVIDARVLEDKAATAAVAAHTSLSGGTGAGSVHGNYLSARLPVRPTAGTPPSRGAKCSAVTGTTTFVATAQKTCAATDGDFSTVAHLSGPAGKVVTGVAIDLGAVRRITLVVARGLASTFTVELSTDGTTYQQVALGNGSAAALSPPGDQSARFVRLRSPSGLDESLLSEVSVW